MLTKPGMKTRRAVLAGLPLLLIPALAGPPSVADAQEQPSYVEMEIGNPDASVTIFEYASFTCPHCASFHTQVFKRLKPEFIDNGTVRYVFREVYFDRFGLWAGILARCGGEDKYFGIVDILFERQQSWSRLSEPSAVATRLAEIGRAAGITDEEISVCFQDQANAELLVQKYKEFSEQDNITSTPSFVINGRNYSNMGYEEFVEILENELGN